MNPLCSFSQTGFKTGAHTFWVGTYTPLREEKSCPTYSGTVTENSIEFPSWASLRVAKRFSAMDTQ